MALGANTTWRWALESPVPELYTRFWGNAVRYLTRSDDAKKCAVSFDRPSYYAGQDFTVRVRTAAQADDRRLDMALIDPSGRRSVLAVTRQGLREWSGSGVFKNAGDHRFLLEFTGRGATAVGESLALNVEPSLNQEETALNNDDALLRRIADASGGIALPSEAFAADSLLKKMKKDGPGCAFNVPL
jgi:hypothetical protein